jgi:hypothetical protein
MKENIDKSLKSLIIDIDKLVPLLGNPRKGNVDAIVASYKEFGQLRPIVAKPNGDGTFTVIAGNHQLEAAKKMGWEQIAVTQYDVDDQKAVAFALADNRTSEMGHTDPTLLQEALDQVVEDYSELLDDLGWDIFELASIEEQADRLAGLTESGYVAPVMIDGSAPSGQLTSNISVQTDENGSRIVPTNSVDSRSVAATGSTSINASGSSNAVVQYTLVFDDPDQQSKWYSFIRWLRLEPSIDGETTAQRLMNFIDAHSDY